MITDFKSVIVSKLSGVINLSNVADIQQDKVPSFPTCEVTFHETREESSTNRNNRVTYVFKVLIYDNLQSETSTKAEVEDRMDEAADAVSDVLRKISPNNFGTNVVFCNIATGFSGVIDASNGKSRALELLYSVIAQEERFPCS